MPLQAFFSDMDGTLLNAQHRISPYTIDVLKRLKEKGICFIVSTGRPYPDVFATLQKCGLEPDYIITSNGARVHDRDHKLIISHDMPPEAVSQLLRLAQKHRSPHDPSERLFSTHVYRDAEWFMDQTIPIIMNNFDPALASHDVGDALFAMPPSELHGVHEVWFQSVEPGKLVDFDRDIQRDLADVLTGSLCDVCILDVGPKDISKGGAMEEVCALLGFDVANVAAFGDALNDYEMLRRAGKAYLPANSLPRLMELLPQAEVIARNTEDGVAKKLEELFLS